MNATLGRPLMPDKPTVTDSEEAAASALGAPGVVVVVVTHDGGPWFEECLAGIAGQDYPNLSVLVIDAASSEAALPRVAEVMPSAYVRRLDVNPGIGAATNEVLSMVEGAPFLLLCHDDILMEPDVVRLLVEEAYRSNAGIVGPKLVAWGAPERLLQVGLSVDKTGVASSHVDRGELDQEQHDAVRDVFMVPGACTLVRSDLFHMLGGYDPGIDFLGEDLDLCWRAQLAGARVLVVPDARVQHQEALASRRPVDDRRRLQARHRLRTMLSVYGMVHLLRVLPQAVLFTIGEMAYALVSGHPGHVADVASAWAWNLRRIGELRRRRHQIQRTRVLDDHEIRRLQIRGSARLLGFLRGELGRASPARALEEARQEFAELQESLADARSRVVPITIGATALVLLFAIRGLLGGSWPEFGSIAGFDVGPLALVTDYLRGWHAAGIDASAPAPTASALIGLAGMVFLGAMGVLQHVLVLGTLPLGLVGVWRMSAPFDSRIARVVTLVVYAAVPLPFNALAQGRWAGLVLYAAAPWMLRFALHASVSGSWGVPGSSDGEVGDGSAEAIGGIHGFHGDHQVEGVGRGRPVIALGLVLALVSAFVPMALPVFFVLSAVIAVFGALAVPDRTLDAHRVGGFLSPLGLVLAASGLAAVLHAPWLVGMLVAGATWESLAGVAPLGPGDAGLTDLMVFGVGPHRSPLVWGLVFAASLGLLIGKRWRFGAAAHMWGLLLASWALALVADHNWLPVPLPGPEVPLSFGGVGLAMGVGLGVCAFEHDLRGERFGWRQAISLVAGTGAVLGVMPVFGAVIDGRVEVPKVGLDRTLGFLEDEARKGPGYRVLWVGDAEVLPLAGRELGGDVAVGVSANGFPDLDDHWQRPAGESEERIVSAMKEAARGQTEHLGRIVAPLGVRYVILVEQLAPHRALTGVHPLPRGLTGSVARQLDLRRLDIDPAVALYENTEWRASGESQSTDVGISWWFVLVASAQVFGWATVLRRAFENSARPRAGVAT